MAKHSGIAKPIKMRYMAHDLILKKAILQITVNAYHTKIRPNILTAFIILSG